MGCCESHLQKIKNKLVYYSRSKVEMKLSYYKWDVGVIDCFANRICMENLVSLTVAKKWIELYSYFMIYVGWLFNPSETLPKHVPKPSADINSYLIIPYEILQVWRTHVLYTDKYSELCKIVSDGNKEFIEFQPPKYIWLNQQMESLVKSFKLNQKMIFSLSKISKIDVKDLFEFKSSYLKNTINFNLEEGGHSLESQLKFMRNKLVNLMEFFQKRSSI